MRSRGLRRPRLRPTDPPRADRAAAPVVATVLMVTVAVILAAVVYAVVLPTMRPADIPTAMLKARVQRGWVWVDHLGGDRLTNVTVETVVDGVPWERSPVDLSPGQSMNTSRPAPDPAWAVDVEVRDRGWTIYRDVVRDGTRDRRPADLVPGRIVWDRAAGRIEATVWNLGPSPTPERRHALVWFWIDGEDPSLAGGSVTFPSWRSNRNLTPAPIIPGGSFHRVRTYDPDLLPPGPHTLEVVVNINKAGHSNLDEVRYDNNGATITV